MEDSPMRFDRRAFRSTHSSRKAAMRVSSIGWYDGIPRVTLLHALCVWLLACALAILASAQQRIRFDSGTNENSQPLNSANDIVQTRDGCRWFATGGGLVRFAGGRFVFRRGIVGIQSPLDHTRLPGRSFCAARHMLRLGLTGGTWIATGISGWFANNRGDL
jgi:hypothetical protein